MQKLYENIGSYFAFDPHSVSVEEFFGELANFRMLFMVSANFQIFCTRTQTRSFKVGTYVDLQKPPPTRAHTFAHAYLHTLGVSELRTEVVYYTCTHFHQTSRVLTGGENLCENYTAVLSWMHLNRKRGRRLCRIALPLV